MHLIYYYYLMWMTRDTGNRYVLYTCGLHMYSCRRSSISIQVWIGVPIRVPTAHRCYAY